MKKNITKRIVTALTTGILALALLAAPCITFAAASNAGTAKEAAATDKAAKEKKELTYEQAREIALKDAGLEGKDVTWFETQKDKDKKTKTVTWDLGFFLDDTEYEYEININDGKIVEKSTEKMSAQDKAENEQQALTLDSILKDHPDVAITADQALEIALKDAGVDLSAVQILKNNLDNDDGVIIYEIEFSKDNKKYDYDIDANSGAVLDKDSESAADKD